MSAPPLRPLLALAIAACATHVENIETSDAPAVAVQTAVAVERLVPASIPLTGELVASAEARVAADAQGVVTALRVERGQHVEKGAVLATVDARTAQLSADAAGAQRSLAEVQLRSAQDECTRAERLHAQAAMPTAQYDRTIAQCRAQVEALQAAAANASLAGASVAKAQIRAPFSGRIGERLVEVGEFVAAAQPVVTLYADEALRVRFSVPERQSAGVAEGQDARFAVTTAPGAWRHAVVRYVSPALRSPQRDLLVEAEVSDVSGLRPGMFAEVQLAVSEVRRVTVPDDAVRTEGSVHTLVVLREGRAFRTVVRIGSSSEGSTAVLTDLSAGDVVVLHPPDTLQDGAPVTASGGN